MVVWHRGQANIATPGGGWINVRQPGHANTGSICPTACRASGGDICEPGTGPTDDDFVVMGILGRWIVIRTESSTKIVAPATRDQTDVRRIPAVRASQTPGFEKIVQDRAFFAQTDFQPIPLGSTQGESRAPGQMRARVSCVTRRFKTRIDRVGNLPSDTPLHLCVAPPEDLRIKPKNT